jgi:enoyl-CoA hydratase/carnithine racemase
MALGLSMLDKAMREVTDGRLTVSTRADGRVTIVTIERPERRNAVDLETACALFGAFNRFDADPNADVAVLTGAGGAFCAGADLKAIAEGEARPIERDGAGRHGDYIGETEESLTARLSVGPRSKMEPIDSFHEFFDLFGPKGRT